MGKRISTKIFCFIVLAILLPSSLMLWNVKSTMEKAIHEEVQEKTAAELREKRAGAQPDFLQDAEYFHHLRYRHGTIGYLGGQATDSVGKE